MTPNPIVEEVRRAREALLARFGGDLDALVDYLRQRERAEGRKVVSLPPKPARQPAEVKRAS